MDGQVRDDVREESKHIFIVVFKEAINNLFFAKPTIFVFVKIIEITLQCLN